MDFNETRYLYRAQHFSGVASAGTTTHIDYKITSNDLKLGGVELVMDNVVDGDNVGFSVVDVDGVYAPAGTTLASYTTGWFLDPSTKRLSVEPGYLSDVLPINAYIRVSYHSVGTADVNVRVNLPIHKVKPV